VATTVRLELLLPNCVPASPTTHGSDRGAVAKKAKHSAALDAGSLRSSNPVQPSSELH
jgi:hypothetical protein